MTMMMMKRHPPPPTPARLGLGTTVWYWLARRHLMMTMRTQGAPALFVVDLFGCYTATSASLVESSSRRVEEENDCDL